MNVQVTFRTASYNIVLESSEGGVIIPNSLKAKEGETVTLTPDVYEEYEFVSVSVKAQDGSTVETAVDEETGVYTVTMPASDVTVSGTFRKIEEPAEADKSELEQLVGELQKIDLTKYTEESVKVLTDALAEAEDLLKQDLAESDQQLITDMIAKLNAAREQLVPVKEDPENPGSGGEDPDKPVTGDSYFFGTWETVNDVMWSTDNSSDIVEGKVRASFTDETVVVWMSATGSSAAMPYTYEKQAEARHIDVYKSELFIFLWLQKYKNACYIVQIVRKQLHLQSYKQKIKCYDYIYNLFAGPHSWLSILWKGN